MRKTIALALISVLAISTASQSQAAKCVLNGKTVFVEQAGAGRISFSEWPSKSSSFSGKATFTGHTGNFTGTLSGRTFDVTVTWDSGAMGHYVWIVDSSGKIEGRATPADGGTGVNITGNADYCSKRRGAKT